MRRLIPTRRDERGVSIAFLALLITVLVAMAALVVDIGSLQAERRELQNGADAGALALAQKCATGPGLSACYPDEMAQATGLAGANANDGLSNVDSVTHGVDPSTGARTVTVVTSTSDSAGTILPYYFAQVITGNVGQTLHATATAAWGPPAEAKVFGLGLSDCGFRFHTTNGTNLDDPDEVFIYRVASPEHPDEEPACFANPVAGGGPPRPDADGNGALEGGFAWFGDLDDDCQVTVRVGEWVPEAPTEAQRKGAAPAQCVDNVAQMNNANVLVPIFDDSRNIGTGLGEYHIRGFAAFRVTGYRFSDTSFFPAPPKAPPCAAPGPSNPNPTCIRGRWVTYPGTIPGVVGGPDFGVVAVSLVA